jgi:uncharacterized protein HemX
MKQTRQQASSKVVPFTGEFYPTAPETTTAPNLNAAYLVMFAAALVGGLSLGAIFTYQSADQMQLRQMKADQAQLQDVKTQVCRQ